MDVNEDVPELEAVVARVLFEESEELTCSGTNNETNNDCQNALPYTSNLSLSSSKSAKAQQLFQQLWINADGKIEFTHGGWTFPISILYCLQNVFGWSGGEGEIEQCDKYEWERVEEIYHIRRVLNASNTLDDTVEFLRDYFYPCLE